MESKSKGTMKAKKVTEVLFCIYLIILSWIILFKMEVSLSFVKNTNLRSVNFIPFAGSLIINGKVHVSEIILNIAAFIPFGVYISMLKREWGIMKKVAPVFGVSLLYETLQYILAIGASDITDLLGNTTGGVLGIGIFFVLSKMWKRKTGKILNIFAAIGTAVGVLFLGLLIIVNM